MLRSMRIGAPLIAVLVFAGLSPSLSHAATAEQEQAFVDAYKQAFEARDGDALKALLYTEGADRMALEFYGQMMTADFGGTITDIGLKDLTADDVKKAGEVMPGPAGGKFRPEAKALQEACHQYPYEGQQRRIDHQQRILCCREGRQAGHLDAGAGPVAAAFCLMPARRSGSPMPGAP